MVNITNGTSTLTVSLGAYEEIFKPQGYIKVKESEVLQNGKKESKVISSTESPAEASEDGFDIKNDESEMNDPDEFEEEDSEEEDLSEKPISEMSFKELKEYATSLSIDFDDNIKKNVLKNKIKAVLNG